VVIKDDLLGKTAGELLEEGKRYTSAIKQSFSSRLTASLE
jgi:hypothetical protein